MIITLVGILFSIIPASESEAQTLNYNRT